MNGCLLLRTLFLGVVLLPVLARGQSEYSHSASYNLKEEGISLIHSNVPLNEINIHAFRSFRRHFPDVSGESWIKSEDGYLVSFMENTFRRQAHFDKRGAFLYSLKYYGEDRIPSDLAGAINKKYTGYLITVVTEINDGNKTFYIAKIENFSYVKTLTICDGIIAVLEELANGKNAPPVAALAP